MEKVKKESKKAHPALKYSQLIQFGCIHSHAGSGVFDQGHESMEIRELTESAVTLIAHLAKLTQTNQLKIEIGYNIVEQVCEVDEARPIVVVREGLLAIVIVEWISTCLCRTSY
jgi:hypothetical protein